jgi:hypothetical protein
VVANVVGDGAALFLGAADTPAPLTAFDHADPERAVLMGAVLHYGRPDKAMYADRVRTTETALLVPQVPQREVRSMLRPEFHQVLGEVGFYSAITVPVVSNGVVAGSLFAGRDTPGRPYTVEDRDFIAAVASRVGLATSRAASGWRAWTLRARLADELSVHSAAEDAVARAAEWLNSSAANGDQLIALVDLDMNVVAMTKGCAVAMGTSVPDAVGSPLEKLLRPFEAVHSTFERLVAGELDYATVVTGAANSDTSLVLDAVMVRGPDATPCCVAYVAHERPEASSSA